MPASCDVLPADRQVRGRLQVLVDDRAVPNGRARGRGSPRPVNAPRRPSRASGSITLVWASGRRSTPRLTFATPRIAYIGMDTDSDGDSPYYPARLERRRFRVRGVVQGVGFRPFVYGLAGRHGLGGFVLNDGDGVTVEAEGDAAALDAFAASLRTDAPPLARVEAVDRRAAARPGRGGVHDRAQPGLARSGRDPAGRGDLRRLPAGAVRPGRPPLPLPVPELHPVRPALHDRPLGALRPRDRRRWPASRCAPTAGASTRTRPTGASTRSRPPAPSAGRGSRCRSRRRWRCSGAARSWRSRGSAATTSPATRATRTPSRRCAPASGARRSRSR